MLKLHRLIHHILLSIGILFGVTLTGSALNTKAAQTNYSNYNNTTINQNTYNNENSEQSSVNLVNSNGSNYQYNRNNQNQHNINSQTVNQRSNKICNHILKSARHNDHHHHKKNANKLSKAELEARSWLSWHESNHKWKIISYGGVCVGYFQLDPQYLGYHNGHVNLNKEHQIKVADSYVQNRYGSWINAKKFWEVHHWY